MLSRDFCFWLQGFFELSEITDRITADQAMLIRRHLDLVFAREDFLIMRETPTPLPHQQNRSQRAKRLQNAGGSRNQWSLRILRCGVKPDASKGILSVVGGEAR